MCSVLNTRFLQHLLKGWLWMLCRGRTWIKSIIIQNTLKKCSVCKSLSALEKY